MHHTKSVFIRPDCYKQVDNSNNISNKSYFLSTTHFISQIFGTVLYQYLVSYFPFFFPFAGLFFPLALFLPFGDLEF